ncbi:MAG: hypothetical protein ACE5EL_02980, partial [Anaerolineae bacterium]
MIAPGAAGADGATPTPQGRLRELADRPAEQAAFALTLLDRPGAILDVQAALGVLAEAEDPGLR